MKFKKIITCLAVLSMAFSLVACGNSSKSMVSDNAFYDDKMAPAMAGGDFYDYGFEEAEYDASYDNSGSTYESVGEMTDSQPTNDRKLIKTVNLDVETKEFDALLNTVEAKVNQLGGYIENSNTYNGSNYLSYKPRKNSYLTIRIPQNNLDLFVDAVSGIANVTNKSNSVEDITLQYVDVESHKEALEVEYDRLLALLEKAENMEDILVIEERMTNVRYQLQSMESQLRTYDNKVNYSTVYLNITEVEELTPVEKESVGERIVNGFTSSLSSVGEGLVDFFVGLVVNLPYIVIWAIVIAIIVLIVIAIVKKVKKNAGKRKEKRVAKASRTIENNVNNVIGADDNEQK